MDKAKSLFNFREEGMKMLGGGGGRGSAEILSRALKNR